MYNSQDDRCPSEKLKKNLKHALGCGHPLFDWDCHQYCFPCREKGGGVDIGVKSKEDDCYNCLQFTAEQKHKLRSKTNTKEKNPAIVITKEVKDSLLGVESHPSTVRDLILQTTTPEPSNDHLQQILQRLQDMQGQITSL